MGREWRSCPWWEVAVDEPGRKWRGGNTGGREAKRRGRSHREVRPDRPVKAERRDAQIQDRKAVLPMVRPLPDPSASQIELAGLSPSRLTHRPILEPLVLVRLAANVHHRSSHGFLLARFNLTNLPHGRLLAVVVVLERSTCGCSREEEAKSVRENGQPHQFCLDLFTSLHPSSPHPKLELNSAVSPLQNRTKHATPARLDV